MILKPLKNTVELKAPNGEIITWGRADQWVLFAGPDSFESYELVKDTALEIQKITKRLGIPWILKCSFDKANRSSNKTFRGLGMEDALKGLEKLKGEVGCALVTDVHETIQVDRVAKVAEVLQIPAFLSRQTDLIQAAAKTGRVLHIKKGQFLAPWDMGGAVQKSQVVGNSKVLLCERGSSFGYNRLVVDMMGLREMRDRFQVPVIMDATHAVQLPGAQGDSSGGNRAMIEVLARGAMAVGIDGLFLEVHPDPDNALCDGPNSLRLDNLDRVLTELQGIWKSVQGN